MTVAQHQHDTVESSLPAPRPLAAALVTGAIGLDVIAHHPLGLATTMPVLAMLAVTGHVIRVDHGSPASRVPLALLGAATMFAALLSIRSSVWLVWLNAASTIGLVTVFAAHRPGDQGIEPALRRLARPALATNAALFARQRARGLARIGADRSKRLRSAMSRPTLIVGVPAVVTLAAILSSADALFASYLQVPFDVDGLGTHSTAALGGVVLTVAALALAGADEPGPRHDQFRMGAGDGIVLTAAFAALSTGFLATRAAAAIGGADYVESTTGLTYAEYARSGFFQLVAATVLILVVLAIVQTRTDPSPPQRRALDALELTVVASTLGIVATTVHRLLLYEAEFGLTMLRMFTTLFALWLGFVVVAAGARIAGRLPVPLGTTIVVSVLAGLVVVNTINPEARVAQRNLDRFASGEELDIEYLFEALGPDALPVLLAHPTTAAVACELDAPDGSASAHLARIRARDAHDRVCGGSDDD